MPVSIPKRIPFAEHRMHASIYLGGFLNWRGINPITSAFWVWPTGLRTSYSRAGAIENVKKKNTPRSNKIISRKENSYPSGDFVS
jgi:hypothetical protein